jgi:hypothetical protein
VDPIATFEQLESATKLSSADDRPFRIAISVALKNQLPEKLKEWCEKYEKSQFGGSAPIKNSILFHGIGLRELALEVIGELGTRQFSRSMGLRLGETVTYEFTLEKKVFAKELQLHLGIVPGISVVLEKLQMYAGGRRGALFLGKDLVLSSWSGFHLDDGRILTVSRDGEMVSILSPRDGFGEADRIEATVGFRRLGVASPSPCGKKRTP